MTTVSELVVQHLVAFQKRQQKSDDAILVDAAIVKFQLKLEELSLSNKLSNMTVETSDNGDDAGTLDEQMTSALITCIDCTLLSFDGSNSSSDGADDDDVSQVLDFITGIAALSTSGTVLLQLVEQRVIVACAAALDRTRIFGCRLLRAIIKCSSSSDGTDDDDDDDDMMEQCVAALLPRLTDKAQAVRLAAIHACGAFPANESVQEALLWSLAHDPSVSSRCAALSSVHLSNSDIDDDALDQVISRLRDVKSKVRVAAVEKLMRLDSVTSSLTPHQCATIVRAGLMSDRCKETSDATTVLLCTRWIKQAKYDPLVLLAHLNPSIYEQECETAIQTLLKVANDSSEASAVFVKDLSDAEIGAFRQGMNASEILNNDDAWKPETLLVARLQCDQAKLSPAKKADLLSKVVPDIPLLCDAIQKCIDTLANLAMEAEEGSTQEQEEEAQVFICNQLFKLAQLMDLQEEGSRRHFVIACKALLSSIHTAEELLEEAIKAMSRAHDLEDEYLQSISDIVEKMTKIQAIDDANDSETQRLVQLRVVSILTIVLENTSPRMALHPCLKSFVHHVVPAVTSDDALIREAGVGCLGRLALLSEEATVLAEFKPLFLEVTAREEETMEIRAQAMLALCDLTMLFDNILVPINDDGVHFVDVVSCMLQNDNPSVVAVAAEVATKLLFSGKVQNKTLLASLLVVFFNKAYDEYDADDQDVQEVGSVYRMQQLLSLFFAAYSMKSQQCKSRLVSALHPMLEMVATKQKRKRGATKTWPVSKMIEFVYATVDEEEKEDPAADKPKTSSSALLICLEISSFLGQHNENLTVTNLRTLCKLLGGADVDVETDDTRNLVALREKVSDLGMLITDEAALESLETMMEVLEEVVDGPVANNEDGGGSLVDAMERITLDKENSRASTSSKQATGDNDELEARKALAAVN